MHKVKIGIPLFLIMACCVFDALKIIELSELKNRKEHLEELRKQIDNFAGEIRGMSFSSLKSKEKLFAEKGDTRQHLKEIARKLNFKKVLIKQNISQNIEEVKILAPQEREIYKFLDDLFFELPGIVNFKSIKISSTADANGDIAAIIQFSSTALEEHPSLIFLKEKREKYEAINFFKKIKTHNLFCTINNSRAYIDNFWFRIGDDMGDGVLKNVGTNFIEVQKEDGSIAHLKLGSQW